MSLHVLDSDTTSHLQHRHPNVVRMFDSAIVSHMVAITVITVEEEVDGWQAQMRRSKSPAVEAQASIGLADSIMFLSKFHILPITEAAIARFEQLKRLKLNVGRMDLRI